MKKKLIIRGVSKLLSGVISLGLVLFLPAGTFAFPGAWRMMAVLFIPMLIMGTVLFLKAPTLLEKRLGSKESEQEQKNVILFSAIIFIASFVLCGLDFRFRLTVVPMWAVIAGCVVFLFTYAGFAELLRENEYLSRTVEVQEGQKVISTGLYGIVRHPMYAIILFMFLSMPIIIGSWIGLIPLAFLPLILVKRIVNEEKVLAEGLKGYEEYKKTVRYRLVPFIW